MRVGEINRRNAFSRAFQTIACSARNIVLTDYISIDFAKANDLTLKSGTREAMIGSKAEGIRLHPGIRRFS